MRKLVASVLLLSMCSLWSVCFAEDIDELSEEDYILMPEWNELEEMDMDFEDEDDIITGTIAVRLITPAALKAAAASDDSIKILEDGETIIAILSNGVVSEQDPTPDDWGNYTRCILLFSEGNSLKGAIETKPDGSISTLLSTDFLY